MAEGLDGNGHLTYYATVQNQGSNAATFQCKHSPPSRCESLRMRRVIAGGVAIFT